MNTGHIRVPSVENIIEWYFLPYEYFSTCNPSWCSLVVKGGHEMSCRLRRLGFNSTLGVPLDNWITWYMVLLRWMSLPLKKKLPYLWFHWKIWKDMILELHYSWLCKGYMYLMPFPRRVPSPYDLKWRFNVDSTSWNQ